MNSEWTITEDGHPPENYAAWLERHKRERITSETGGTKDQKDIQLSQMPYEALQELGRVYSFGARKYDRYNFRRGYAWSLSFDALLRHLFAWWGGQDDDTESGLSHMAHACWHTMCLIFFSKKFPEYDDRPKDGSYIGI